MLPLFDSRELASGLTQQKQIELRHLGELALGIVKEEYAAAQKGGLADADAQKRAMARLAAFDTAATIISGSTICIRKW